MTITIVPATKVQIIKMAITPESQPVKNFAVTGWFSNMLNDLFVPDPQSRITSDQISEVFNYHYIELGLPMLRTNSKEVGHQLAKMPEVGRHLLNGKTRYHLGLKPEIQIPGLVYTTAKPYRRLALRQLTTPQPEAKPAEVSVSV
jgi:hypothetical protein